MTFFNQLKERYEEGKTLPQEFYTDEEIFSDEMKKIYFKQWLMVDHVSRIPNPGDYFLFNAEKESIILIRGRDTANMVNHQPLFEINFFHFIREYFFVSIKLLRKSLSFFISFFKLIKKGH
jgi:hypothetical protein